MRILYLLGDLASAVVYCMRAVAVAVDVVCDFGRDVIMAPFRLDLGAARDFVDRYILSAFRIIGLLKPEYRESLQTDGQSHLSPRAVARLC